MAMWAPSAPFWPPAPTCTILVGGYALLIEMQAPPGAVTSCLARNSAARANAWPSFFISLCPPPIAGPEYTPLHYAAEKGHVEAVKALLGAGADPCKPTSCSKKIPPIHTAAHGGNAALITVLLQAGASAHSVRADTGWSPLHQAG